MHGVLQDLGSSLELRFERTFDVEPERLFAAISEDAGLSQWYPTTIEGERRPGAALSLVFTADDGPPLSGEVLEFESGRVFAFQEGDNTLRMEVEKAGGGSQLVFAHRFPKGGSAARTAAGWHVSLELLANHLAGGGAQINRELRFTELHGEYLSRFVEGVSA